MNSPLPPDRPEPENVPTVFESFGASRRSILRGALAGGLAVLGIGWASGPAGAATRATSSASKIKNTTKTGKKAGSAAAARKATTPTTKAAAAVAGKVFPNTSEVVVAFSFVPTDSRAHNPFVAVWIENSSGLAVRTIELSFLPGKGLRWLPELRRWFGADQVRQIAGGTDLIATVSSATRLPGKYTVAWDGRNDAKALVPQGEYVLCIEAAREDGPYSLIKAPMTIGDTPFSLTAPANGELADVKIDLLAKK